MAEMNAFNPYRVLGIRRNAPAARIKKAFRKRSKDTHPDVGGSQDAFMEVRRAYFILADPARRRKYDRDGTIDDQTDLAFHGQVAGYQATLFETLLRQDGAFRRDVDLIKAMIVTTRKEIEGRAEERANGREFVKRLRVMQARIQRAGPPGRAPNLFSAILDRKCDGVRSKLAEIDAKIRVMRAALKELESYTCVTEMAQQLGFFHSQATTSTGL